MCFDDTFKTGFGLSQLIYHPPSVANSIHVLNEANLQPNESLLTTLYKHLEAQPAALAVVQGKVLDSVHAMNHEKRYFQTKPGLCCAFETDAKNGARPDVIEVDLSIVAAAGFVAFSLPPHSLYIGFIEVGIRDEDHALNGQQDLEQAAVLWVPFLRCVCAMPRTQQGQTHLQIRHTEMFISTT